jgi:NADP-dependent 3-hydroxy acid dehydrogenase YdfG
VYCGSKFAVRAISEGLRMEIGPDIRTTIISPGAVKSELAEAISDPETAKNVRELINVAIDADAVARAIAFAIEQPKDVDINEIVVRPTAQAL